MNMMPARTPAEESLGVSLPSRRDEEWKWTDLRRLVDRPYRAPAAADGRSIDTLLKAAPLAHLAAERVVLVNGVFDAGRSKLSRLQVTPEAPAIGGQDALLTLNAKLGAKTVALRFEGNIDTPVEVVHIAAGEGAAIASRLHIAVEKASSATVIETFLGEGEYLRNPVTSVTVSEGGRLDHIKLETEAAAAQHLSHLVATLSANAQLNAFAFNAGAQLARQNGDIIFQGEGGNAQVSGAYLLNGRQHVDTRLVVDHAVPHCTSRELFKCVMNGNSRGIFQGKVIVRPDAQKTDGKQSSHALLLADGAEFNAKPELEIYADDVVCGHGSTCGDLNHDHIFYLQSRGIPEAKARAMLVEAFVGEAMETVENEPLRDALVNLVHERMS